MNLTATFKCSHKIFSLPPQRCGLLTVASNVDSKAFSKTSFPLWPDRENSDVALRSWICEDLYRAQVGVAPTKSRYSNLVAYVGTLKGWSRICFA
ncbi:hypothetical protein ARMSODRAFT_94433 [Armillaria solidipes]|uniref:Uncharacterized protein n=1 Tax=Armillaria solidipes TaxID=1076256 RepID=A0A2H3BXS3_9AGAR|nr:hypothetical protein ARMSODRAFT_94433 [Armillaria solidipes]